jgi:hypothetical protein
MLRQDVDREKTKTANAYDMSTLLPTKSPTPLDLFNRALNAFLLPYEICADDCDIFKDVLFRLANIRTSPIVRFEMEFDAASGKMIFKLHGVDRFDTENFVKFLQGQMLRSININEKNIGNKVERLTYKYESPGLIGSGVISNISISLLYYLLDVFIKYAETLSSEALAPYRKESRYHSSIQDYHHLKEIKASCLALKEAKNIDPEPLGMIKVLSNQICSAIKFYVECLTNQDDQLRQAEEVMILQFKNILMARSENDALSKNVDINKVCEQIASYGNFKYQLKSRTMMNDYAEIYSSSLAEAAKLADQAATLDAPAADLPDSSSVAGLGLFGVQAALSSPAPLDNADNARGSGIRQLLNKVMNK